MDTLIAERATAKIFTQASPAVHGQCVTVELLSSSIECLGPDVKRVRAQQNSA